MTGTRGIQGKLIVAALVVGAGPRADATTAAAPSESCDEFPAVIDDLGSSTPLSLSKPSSVVSGRLPSSFVSVKNSSRASPVSLSSINFQAGSGTIDA